MAVTKVAIMGVIVTLVLLALELGSICQAADASRTPGLFVDLAHSKTEGDQQAPADPTILRSRFVGINWDMMNYPDGTAESRPGSANRIVLNLFEDTSLNTVLDRWEDRSTTSFNWLGHIEGIPSSQVTLVVEDGVMVGNIRVAAS